MARVSAFLEALGRVVGGILDAVWRALSSDPEDRLWDVFYGRAAANVIVSLVLGVATAALGRLIGTHL